jgi:hypothetical protein
MFRSLCLILVACFTGCGASTGTVQDVSKEAGEGIVQLRDLLVDSGKPLQKQAEMAEFAGRYPVAVDEVSRGSLAVVWGTGIQEGSSGSAAIIAYQKDAETQGGWVIRADAKIEKLSADEFKNAAPPKSAAKK